MHIFFAFLLTHDSNKKCTERQLGVLIIICNIFVHFSQLSTGLKYIESSYMTFSFSYINYSDYYCCVMQLYNNFILRKELILQHQAQAMINRQMQFLNHISFCMWNFNTYITYIIQFTVFFSSQSNNLHSFCMGSRCCK